MYKPNKKFRLEPPMVVSAEKSAAGNTKVVPL